MIDWNQDGKHDYEDHTFYNNVVEPKTKKLSLDNKSSSTYRNTETNTHTTFSCNSGLIWFIVLYVLYGLIKLLA